MKDYKPILSFGEEAAATYRDVQRGDELATVDFLAGLAGDGPALELAIGAGRIALPLTDRGIRVDGVEFAPAMIAELRNAESRKAASRKNGGAEALKVTLGDFADVPVTGNYRLIYVVWNTLFNLTTQDDQVRCFENVAAHLDDGGSFVVEAFLPDFLYRLRDHQYVDAESIGMDEVRLDVGRHDPAKQELDESHVSLSADGVRLNPIVSRYAWPSELDLMARIAGLRLKERWSSWERAAFDGTGRNVLSVWVR